MDHLSAERISAAGNPEPTVNTAPASAVQSLLPDPLLFILSKRAMHTLLEHTAIWFQGGDLGIF